MSKAHLTHANEVYFGSKFTYGSLEAQGRKGVPLHSCYHHTYGAVAALDADGHCAAQAIAAAGYATLNGALAGVNDVARGVRAASSAAGDTTQTITVVGKDIWGDTVAETISLNGTTAVNGKKAFKELTTVYVSAALAGNLTVGNNDVIGLPFVAATKSRIQDVWFNDAKDASATIVTAASATATATTGDTRGTIDPNSACNGSVVTVVMIPDASNLHGVAQYAG